MTPYYDDGSCVIYHGDCRDVMERLSPPRVTLASHDAGSSRLESDLGTGSLGGTPASLRVDLVLADPPYNVGKDYGEHDDDQDPIVYGQWCTSWYALTRKITTRAVVFPGHGNVDIWYGIQRPTAIGCWYKPGNPASSMLGWCEWEPWLYWGPRVGGSDVVRATVSEQSGVGNHPCPKPLLLIEALLLKFKSECVLDPFMGSGTTLRAAKDLGRRAIGIEIEERYCETAARRLGQEVLAL